MQLAGFHMELGRMKIGPAYDEIIRKAFGITSFTGATVSLVKLNLLSGNITKILIY